MIEMKNKSNIVSLPRALSKLGFCSRKVAVKLISEGKVLVNSTPCYDPKRRVDISKDRIVINDKILEPQNFIYILLNKPKGLITTAKDEKGRDTVYKCFEGHNLPYIFPVGRLDKASEGLLLFTNDTNFANYILAPENRIEKAYHVKINRKINDEILKKIKSGIKTNEDELLTVKSIRILREGQKTCWLEIILDEGRNRHIRRIFETLRIEILRLVRVSIGQLKLGELPKGKFRFLRDSEINNLFKRS